MKNKLHLIDLILEIRKISQQNLPVETSFIPYDILIFLYKTHANKQVINLKDFFRFFNHSEMGVRYHLKRLINDGWVSLADSPTDRRSKLLVMNARFIEQMKKTLFEIGLYMQLQAFLSTDESFSDAERYTRI